LINRLLAGALQVLTECEATAVIGAAPHQRTATRTTQRNGSRPKSLTTAAGDVTVGIPKTRTGSFFPELARAAPADRPGAARGDL
jgi:putative transposase